MYLGKPVDVRGLCGDLGKQEKWTAGKRAKVLVLDDANQVGEFLAGTLPSFWKVLAKRACLRLRTGKERCGPIDLLVNCLTKTPL